MPIIICALRTTCVFSLYNASPYYFDCRIYKQHNMTVNNILFDVIYVWFNFSLSLLLLISSFNILTPNPFMLSLTPLTNFTFTSSTWPWPPPLSQHPQFRRVTWWLEKVSIDCGKCSPLPPRLPQNGSIKVCACALGDFRQNFRRQLSRSRIQRLSTEFCLQISL